VGSGVAVAGGAAAVAVRWGAAVPCGLDGVGEGDGTAVGVGVVPGDGAADGEGEGAAAVAVAAGPGDSVAAGEAPEPGMAGRSLPLPPPVASTTPTAATRAATPSMPATTAFPVRVAMKAAKLAGRRIPQSVPYFALAVISPCRASVKTGEVAGGPGELSPSHEGDSMRLRKLSLALGLAAVGAVVLGAVPAMGADHKDAPLTRTMARLDINDLYAFTTPDAVVAVMTVNPLTSPADTAGLRLDTNATYEFKIDTDGDAAADLAYKFTFSGTGPVQDVTIRRAEAGEAHANGPFGPVVATGKTSVGAGVTTIEWAGGFKAYVGPRDDPFFFDLTAFNKGLAFTNPGKDTFAGTNVTAIVLSLPRASRPADNLGFWATTAKPGQLGGWDQVDRMGRPAILTVFIPTLEYVGDTSPSKEDAFNANSPDRDVALWKDTVVGTLNAIGATLNIPAKPELADVLLPDILTIDVTKPTGYLNGRGLADDVIDISLGVITGIAGIGDGVAANDRAFLPVFPYLAAPHGAAAAPAPPNTGSGFAARDGSMVNWQWTLPAGLIAAGLLLAAAGYVQRRRPVTRD
jgi:hypothetical protein